MEENKVARHECARQKPSPGVFLLRLFQHGIEPASQSYAAAWVGREKRYGADADSAEADALLEQIADAARKLKKAILKIYLK